MGAGSSFGCTDKDLTIRMAGDFEQRHEFLFTVVPITPSLKHFDCHRLLRTIFIFHDTFVDRSCPVIVEICRRHVTDTQLIREDMSHAHPFVHEDLSQIHRQTTLEKLKTSYNHSTGRKKIS